MKILKSELWNKTTLLTRGKAARIPKLRDRDPSQPLR